MTIERRYKGAYDVYVPTNYGREHIDTVFWDTSTVDEVRRSLIDHDGYQSDIVVVPVDDPLPLTERELETLCDEGGVRLVQAEEPEVFGRWDWLDDDSNASDMSFETKEEAMLDAVATLGLEPYEDDE